MLKKVKRMLVLPMMMLVMVLTPLVSHAQEEMTQPNIGVSEISPDMRDNEKGASRPSNVWNIKTKGRYNFSGSANTVTIYTNYKFNGKTSYKVSVKNTGKYPLTVKAKTLTKTYGSTKISAGKKGEFTFSNIKSTTAFYVTFEGSEFNGYVE